MPKHDTQDVWYEPHPVAPERKAAIRAFGFRIIDAEFKPAAYVNPDVPELRLASADLEHEAGAHGGEGQPHLGADTNGDGKLSAAELKAALTEKGIAFRGNASKADLHALLDAAPPVDA